MSKKTKVIGAMLIDGKPVLVKGGRARVAQGAEVKQLRRVALAAPKKPAQIKTRVAAIDALPGSRDAIAWERSTFTDDELAVILATMTQKAPASKHPRDLRERTIAEAIKGGVSVSDAKAIIRRAMTVTPTPAAKPAAAKRAPVVKREPVKREPGAMPGGAKGERFKTIIDTLTKAKKKGATLDALQKATRCENLNTLRANISELRTKFGQPIAHTGDVYVLGGAQ